MNTIINKNIVLVINSLNKGGASKILSWLANQLQKDFTNINIIVFDDSINQHFIDENIKIFNLSMYNKIRLLWRLDLIRLLRDKILDISPDLVISFVSDVNVTLALALSKTHIPFIIAERGNPYNLNFFWKLLTKVYYRKATFRVYQTLKVSSYYEGRDTSKSDVIINPYLNERKINSYNDRNVKNWITSTGRFEKGKRFHILIKAFSRVSKKYPEFQLILLGDGSEKKKYIKLIKKLELENKVLLPGYLNDVENILFKTMIFAFPSKSEGIPNSVIEAMGIGIPVIFSDMKSGASEMLSQKGKRAYFIKKSTVNGFEKGIIQLIKNKDLRESISTHASAVRVEMSPKIIYRHWISVINKVLGLDKKGNDV